MAMEFEDAMDLELSPLEYVIYLGAHGNHVLFDNARIREAFEKREDELADMGSDMVFEVREAVNQVLTIPDFEGKKDYIDGLPKEIQDVLIFLYFQMIERSMLLSRENPH